jgi:hypothetical protein
MLFRQPFAVNGKAREGGEGTTRIVPVRGVESNAFSPAMEIVSADRVSAREKRAFLGDCEK